MGNVLSDSKSGADYIYGNGLEARVKNGKASYYVTDFRGSVVAIVDESGNITHKYQYDEFGKVLQKEEADYNPFQYVGKYGVMVLSDHQYYMRARHYDPTIGRFLSEDPIWSTNLYPYADNNPIMGFDPNGEAVEILQAKAIEKGADAVTWAVEKSIATTKALVNKGYAPKSETDALLQKIEEPISKAYPYVKKTVKQSTSYLASGVKSFIGTLGYGGTAAVGGVICLGSWQGAYELAKYGQKAWGYVAGAGGGAIGGALLGAAAGALSGAAAGSVIPVGGTIAGAVIGAGIGVYAAYKGSQKYNATK